MHWSVLLRRERDFAQRITNGGSEHLLRPLWATQRTQGMSQPWTAWTMARIPLRIGSERVGQALIRLAKSGWFLAVARRTVRHNDPVISTTDGMIPDDICKSYFANHPAVNTDWWQGQRRLKMKISITLNAITMCLMGTSIVHAKTTTAWLIQDGSFWDWSANNMNHRNLGM